MDRYHPINKILLSLIITALFLFSFYVFLESNELSRGMGAYHDSLRQEDIDLVQEKLLAKSNQVSEQGIIRLNNELTEELKKQAPLLIYEAHIDQRAMTLTNIDQDYPIYLAGRSFPTNREDYSDHVSFYIRRPTDEERNTLADSHYYKLFLTYEAKENALKSKRIPAALAFLTAVALSFYYLSISGRNKQGAYPVSDIDRMPLELLLGIYALLSIGSLFVVFEVLLRDGFPSKIWDLTLLGGFLLINFPLIELLMRRIRQKRLIKSSLAYPILMKTIELGKRTFRDLPLIWKGLLASVGYVFLSMFFYSNGQYSHMMMLAYYILQAAFLLYVARTILSRRELRRVTAELAAGNLGSKVNVDELSPGLKDEGELLNQISEGIGIAVNERMKSESFRTELITNVSHDLKTPLTSIISYTDLLKKEGLDSPSSGEYLDALERQSARLKKLMEDILQVSKASTGTLDVHLEKNNVKELLLQVAGEYEEKLQEANLDLVLDLPEEDLFIEADSTLIWRVLDNLLGNARKYSQPGTRVYVSAEKKRKTVRIHIKNISKEQLGITAEELKQRFVRADSSRSSEGSGLGLAIAESLTQLQKGHLFLDIDGDLFKASLIFEEI